MFDHKKNLLVTALGLALAAGPAFAADHRDAPAVEADPSADVNDYYTFVNPNDPEEAILIMTVNPLANNATQFSTAVEYYFLFENSVGQSARIECGFSETLEVNCSVVGRADGVTASAGGALNTINVNDAGDMRVYAGLTDDPFFFDLAAFQETQRTGTPAFTDPGTDFFAGLNTLAIVIGIDADLISPTPPPAKGHYLHKTYTASIRESGLGLNESLDGPWYESDADGRGFYFQVYPSADETQPNRLAAAFFTYDDDDGEPVWLLGVGEYEDNANTVQMAFERFEGGTFAGPMSLADLTVTQSLNSFVTFQGCDQAVVTMFDVPGYGTAQFDLDTRIDGDAAACSFFPGPGPGAKAHLASQKDRMGRPAINTALTPTGQKDAYNLAKTLPEWQQFQDEFVASLMVYDGLDGTTGNLLTGSADTLAGILVDDRLQVNYDIPNCGPYLAIELGGSSPSACGGRTLDRDVIDDTLGAVVGSPVSDNVDANDREFSADFPFLATPN